MICNNCHREMDDNTVYSAVDDQYEVQYLRCRKCGATYQIITTDAESRSLIDRRVKLRQKVQLGRLNGFTERTIRKYLREDEKIKNSLTQITSNLEGIGDRIIMDAERVPMS